MLDEPAGEPELHTSRAKFAGTKTEMVGFQVAVLILVLAPVTTVDTPVRFSAATAVEVTKADELITPAPYLTLLAGSAGPAGGVNAVEITDTVQLVAPPRWSETVTLPSGPEIVLELVDATCDPSDTLPVGARAPVFPKHLVMRASVSALVARP